MDSYTKKNLNLIILKILSQNSSQEYPIWQNDFISRIYRDYGMSVNRKTIKNNVEALNDFFSDGLFHITYKNGYYFDYKLLSYDQIQYIVNMVLSDKSITTQESQDLITRLEKLAYTSFFKTAHFNEKTSNNFGSTLFDKTKQINEAIQQNKKISFIYNEYGIDFKLHPKRDMPYIVNPYELISKNGKYYLICKYDKYSNISHFRVDRIENVIVLEDTRKNINELSESYNYPRHKIEHVYMFSGVSVPIKIKTKAYMMNELVDWFGDDFTIFDHVGDDILIWLISNQEAMFYWLLQYGTEVEVIEPKELRSRVIDAIDNMKRKYGGLDGNEI